MPLHRFCDKIKKSKKKYFFFGFPFLSQMWHLHKMWQNVTQQVTKGRIFLKFKNIQKYWNSNVLIRSVVNLLLLLRVLYYLLCQHCLLSDRNFSTSTRPYMADLMSPFWLILAIQSAWAPLSSNNFTTSIRLWATASRESALSVVAPSVQFKLDNV